MRFWASLGTASPDARQAVTPFDSTLQKGRDNVFCSRIVLIGAGDCA
jgi:hypothetical protein